MWHQVETAGTSACSHLVSVEWWDVQETPAVSAVWHPQSFGLTHGQHFLPLHLLCVSRWLHPPSLQPCGDIPWGARLFAFAAKAPAFSRGCLAQVAAWALGRDSVLLRCFQKCLLMEECFASWSTQLRFPCVQSWQYCGALAFIVILHCSRGVLAGKEIVDFSWVIAGIKGCECRIIFCQCNWSNQRGKQTTF